MSKFGEGLVQLVEPSVASVHSFIHCLAYSEDIVTWRKVHNFFISLRQFDVIFALGFGIEVSSNKVNEPKVQSLSCNDSKEDP